MLQDYVTPDEVRAVLSVAESELTDDVITLPLYELQLGFDLREISTTLAADYLALPADPDTRSAAEQLFFDCTQVYSAYAVAKVLVATLDMFAPKVISDTKTTLQRLDPYAAARAAVLSGYNLMRTRLTAAYSALEPGATVPTEIKLVVASAIGLASDPVTGV